MAFTMPTNLTRAGAQLVHPDKAFVLRHLPPPDDAIELFETNPEAGYVRAIDLNDAPEHRLDYILRLYGAVEGLFGSVDFDFHCYRQYTPEGLTFHSDPADTDDDATLIRMVTCVHNMNDADRVLSFQKPTWTGHKEAFTLPVPANAILAFGDGLMFDYEHGIPPHPSVAEYRSVITRFAKWEK